MTQSVLVHVLKFTGQHLLILIGTLKSTFINYGIHTQPMLAESQTISCAVETAIPSGVCGGGVFHKASRLSQHLICTTCKQSLCLALALGQLPQRMVNGKPNMCSQHCSASSAYTQVMANMTSFYMHQGL